ncbi:potassium transporter [Cryphonectria parasitica EP155]|uniref:Potassium transporter n=1 Tax=Cryphonectria parasitica (strain ATCC 38755 / EP155) TaxID=660469 RepID=A0A9P4XWW6_CRYP1|nr:potassium transporter [Cryphonectria parasitica EP155]KAF3762789.1 potassium transporter [Cryphonectria parasitica EP155]
MVPLSQPATIRIADDVHPKDLRLSESESRFRPLTRTDTTALAGGIYSTRALSRATTQRSISLDRHRTDAFEEEGDNWRESEKPKVKQIYKGTTLLWLAYQSVGAIYGDIGTSPLYVFSSTFTKDPDYDSVIQVLSLVLWSMSIMVTFKYVFIILRADNEGEGGTFSCYSLLTRFANLTERDPREAPLIHMERHLTGNLRPANGKIRSAIEESRFFRGLLKTIGVLAVSMVLSDGVLTPAQSVLGAVQGLNVVKPDISSSTVVGTTCGIIILLFAIQPLGLSRLASIFAPIVILWLGFNGGFGIYNLVKYDYTVLKAFNPYYAFQFFIVNKTEGWKMLGGVLLSFTGVEALFADLGAFSMRAIQLSWMCYTYPCLLLAYTGQAAYISAHPAAWSNPFYNSVPPGMLYPSLVVAVLAAVVASQAIITATFQLISQIMKLSYCPQVKVVHTSKTFHGQLYVPFLNWLLMIGTILVTAIYSNTTRLGNAYGVCVMFVTFFDTCMVTLVALIVWRIWPWLVILPWLFFVLHDGLYLSSALNKVPDGAWFTLTLSAILASLFLLWRFGKENQWKAEAEDRFKLNNLVMKDAEGKLRLTPKWGGDQLSQIRGLGIFFDKTGVMTPSVFTQFASKLVGVMDVTVFFHLHPVEAPTVPDDQRYSVSKFTTIPGCYRLVVKHGFMDEVISPDLAALIYEKVRAFIIRQARSGEALPDGESEIDSASSAIENVESPTNDNSPSTATTTSADVAVLKNGMLSPTHQLPVELRDEVVAAELARLDRAYAAKIMYVVGKGQMKIRPESRILRRAVLSLFLWIRENTRGKIANLRLAHERVMEVGFVKDI